ESELIEGARHLRYLKQEIEAGRRRLQPALAQARQALAQAEMDLEVASKGSPVALTLIAMIVTLIIGLAGKSLNDTPRLREPVSGTAREAPAERQSTEKASALSIEGERLSKEERFEEAVETLREAVRIDPKCGAAYKHLGYALYRLKRYEESVEASEKAI